MDFEALCDNIFPMIRAYELMVVVRSDVEGSDKKHQEIVKKLLGDGVTIKEVKSLGKKQLAYPIKKQTEAVYLLADVEAEALKLDEINKRSKLDDEILRFLLTLKE